MGRKVNKDEALKQLNRYKGKYAEALEEIEEKIETEDDAVIMEEYKGEPITRAEVDGIRNHVQKYGKRDYKVRSTRIGNDPEEHFMVVVFIED
mgnify:CR=1 FL=1